MRIVISNEIFSTLPPNERAVLQVKFADPLMRKFLASQVDAIQKEIGEQDPDKAKSPEEFIQTARDLRLVKQFWTDFLHLAEDWGRE